MYMYIIFTPHGQFDSGRLRQSTIPDYLYVELETEVLRKCENVLFKTKYKKVHKINLFCIPVHRIWYPPTKPSFCLTQEYFQFLY